MSKRPDLLLGLVATVVEQPGLTLEELSRRFGATKKQIREMIDSLTMVGIPPFGPDDYLDIWIEDDDEEVHCQLPLSFDRPVRLNQLEAAAMVLAGKVLGLDELDAPAAMLWSSICDKINAANAVAGLNGHNSLDKLFGTDHVPGETDIFLKQWVEAAENNRNVLLTYYNIYELREQTITIKPEVIEGAGGRYLLIGQSRNGRKTIDSIYIKRILKTKEAAKSEQPPLEKNQPRTSSAVVRVDDLSLIEGFDYRLLEDSIKDSFIVELFFNKDNFDFFCRRALAEFGRFQVLGPDELRHKLVEKSSSLLDDKNHTDS